MRPNRSKKLKKALTELKRTHGYHAPLQILFDRSCLSLCERTKMTIRVFDKTFGETKLFTTKCIFDGLFKERQKTSRHMDRYVDIRKCRHSKGNKHNNENKTGSELKSAVHDQMGNTNEKELKDKSRPESKATQENISVNEPRPLKNGNTNSSRNETQIQNRLDGTANSLKDETNSFRNEFFYESDSKHECSDTATLSIIPTNSPSHEILNDDTIEVLSSIKDQETVCVKSLLACKNRNHYILACTTTSRKMYETLRNVPLLIVHKGGMCEIDMGNFSTVTQNLTS